MKSDHCFNSGLLDLPIKQIRALVTSCLVHLLFEIFARQETFPSYSVSLLLPSVENKLPASGQAHVFVCSVG